MTTLDWSQCPAVESTPGKVGGASVFKGTRMPVATIFENLEAGLTVEEVMEEFSVRREQMPVGIARWLYGHSVPGAITRAGIGEPVHMLVRQNGRRGETVAGTEQRRPVSPIIAVTMKLFQASAAVSTQSTARRLRVNGPVSALPHANEPI
jgi:uncharacterized protein (DUF433 family)